VKEEGLMDKDSVEERLRQMEAREAIARTIALYGQLLDDRRFVEFGELFAPDGVWAIPGMSLEGRMEIVEVLRELEEGGPGSVKHVSLHPIINLDGPDRAQAWTDLMALVPADIGWAVVSTGRYYDTFVCNDGRWQFAVRRAEVFPSSTLAAFAPGSATAAPFDDLPPTPSP
jgi:SnoaL-like domain